MRTIAAAIAIVSHILGQETGRATLTDLVALPHGLYYQSPTGWSKMELVAQAGFATRHGSTALVGVPASVVANYTGLHSPNQLRDSRPVFGIRVDPNRPEMPGRRVTDLIVVRLDSRKDHRELPTIKGGFASVTVGISAKRTTELVVTPTGDLTYTVRPRIELEPGEYLLTFAAANGVAGYDFGVDNR